MKNAEAQGKFHYNPSLVNEQDMNNSFGGLEKEEKIDLMFSSQTSVPPHSTGFSSSTSLPPPLVPATSTPAPAPVQRVPPPQNHVDLTSDEFLDPELDLELEGMNLDGDAGVNMNRLDCFQFYCY
jgi:hypothetical protein